MAYHNNPGMLSHQYAEWRRLPLWVARETEAVICDDASVNEAFYPYQYDGPRVRIFRIPPPHVKWSHRCATNIAVRHAAYEWLLLTDIDHVVPSETLQTLIGAKLRHDQVYTFARRNTRGAAIKPHPDSWLIHRTMWTKLGGWDERYRGYYGQNADIWRRVRNFAGEPVPLPLDLIHYTRDDIPDASSPPDYRENKHPDKAAIMVLRKQFRRAGTFFDSHQMTVPYVGVPNPYGN